MSSKQLSFEGEQTDRERTRSAESRASDDRTSRWEDLLLEAGGLVLLTVIRKYMKGRRGEGSTSDERRRDEEAPAGSEGSGGRSWFWLVAGLGLLAAGYLIRDRYGSLGEAKESLSSRTEEVSERAADRVREQGETVATRAEKVGEGAAQRAEATGGAAGERIEGTSEDVAERVEEKSEDVGEGIEEGGEESSDAVETSQQG